jgi:hypothetical protein
VLLPASGSSNSCFAAEHRQQRVRAQLLVVVEVFVAQRQPVDALRRHLGKLMFDQQSYTAVVEAARDRHMIDERRQATGSTSEFTLRMALRRGALN